MNRKHERDDRQDDVTKEPSEARHDGEITCKGYGPVQPVEEQDDGAGNEGKEDTSSSERTR